MPRIARLWAPDTVHHLISRFVNGEYRLNAAARAAYLERLGQTLARTDSTLLAFALMSSHVHLVVRAGATPLARLIKPLHTGVALWLNRHQKRLGPVFAQRYTSVLCPPTRVAALVAYVHNNPVRAGVVAAATDSRWTSHGAWIGTVAPPPWLDVHRALTLSGFDATAAGRAAFDAFVRSRAGDARSDDFSGRHGDLARRVGHAAGGGAIELATPQLAAEADGPTAYALLASAHSPWRPRVAGEPDDVLRAVARETGVALRRLRAGDRRRDATAARLLALQLWTQHMRRPQIEMSRALGISASAASNLLRRATAQGASRAQVRAAAELVDAHVVPEQGK